MSQISTFRTSTGISGCIVGVPIPSSFLVQPRSFKGSTFGSLIVVGVGGGGTDSIWMLG